MDDLSPLYLTSIHIPRSKHCRKRPLFKCRKLSADHSKHRWKWSVEQDLTRIHRWAWLLIRPFIDCWLSITDCVNKTSEFDCHLVPRLPICGKQLEVCRLSLLLLLRQIARQIGRQAGRQTGRQTDRWTDRQGQTNRRTDRQIGVTKGRQTFRQAGGQTDG